MLGTETVADGDVVDDDDTGCNATPVQSLCGDDDDDSDGHNDGDANSTMRHNVYRRHVVWVTRTSWPVPCCLDD